MKEVKIYSTPTCTYCHMAKEFFDQNGVKYEDYDVASDVDKRNEMVDKSGQMGVPVIIIGDDIIVGFDEGHIRQALGM